MSTWHTVLAILGLAVITVGTRGFFLYPEQELPLPGWLKQGLRYAPLAALAAVVAPEVLMTQGHLHHHLEGRAPLRHAGGHRLLFLAPWHPRHHRHRHPGDDGAAHRPRLVATGPVPVFHRLPLAPP